MINSLRSHLTRLTSELTSHQELLTELRKLRESDAQALRDKGTEITQLREEVQRLAGEVEVLRGVVEEGLNERRATRESHVASVAADVAMSQDLEEDEASEEDEIPEQSEDDSEEDDEKDEPGWASDNDNSIPLVNGPSQANRADRTMRTDHATIGSSNLAGSVNRSPRFVDAEELDNIAAEMDERRSNRSNGSITSQNRPAPSRGEQVGTSRIVDGPALNPLLQPPMNRQPDAPTSRPSAPTPGHAKKQYNQPRDCHDPYPETPFPQIRGPLMERLFFSAPEHNAKTCIHCRRSRHHTNAHSPSRLNPRPTTSYPLPPENRGETPTDEGYEGSDAGDAEHLAADKGKKREYVAFSGHAGHWQKAGRAQGLPPQTVLARHIRELEDDFIHYKR